MKHIGHVFQNYCPKSFCEALTVSVLLLFSNFQNALAFTQLVGEAAEKEGHHPSLLTEWGKVTATWWTHAIKGLHRNDFIMAAKSDHIYTKYI